MPIYSTHPDYKTRIAQWERARDVYEGEDAVKARGDRYLPKLTSHDTSERGRKSYAAYTKRAEFYGATQRTVEAMIGACMRKEPDVKLPKQLDKYRDDITYTGVSLDHFARLCLEEVWNTGRLGLLVDRVGDSRPYIERYIAERVINWMDDAGDLTRIVLQETEYVADEKDAYELSIRTRYRELLFEDGVYVQKIWTPIKRNPTQNEDFSVASVTPNAGNQAMDWLPFVIVTPIGTTAACHKPPLLDLVNVNLSHYRTSADLEHGRHLTALPTPYATGVEDAEPLVVEDATLHRGHGARPLMLGSEVFQTFPDPQTRVGFIEFTGAGLSALEKAIEQKEQRMAVLGARLLEARKAGVEAADTHRLRQAGEQSVAIAIVLAVSAGIENALKQMAVWEGLDPDQVEFRLNTELLDTAMEPAELRELFAAYQGGGLSLESFVWNLKQHDKLPPDRSIDEELAKIKADDEREGARTGHGLNDLPPANQGQGEAA